MKADKIIYGKIYTGDDNDTVVSALAIKDDKIIYSGDENGASEFVYDDTQIVRLSDEQLVISGFMDGHNHLLPVMCTKDFLFNVSEEAASTSASEVVSEISEFISQHPNFPYYMCHNWLNSIFENDCPTADLLDVIDTDKPIVVTDNGQHSYWTNTAMIKLANITKDTPDPEGGKIERYPDGTPNGCFRDTAEFLVRKALPIKKAETMLDCCLYAQNLYESYGYTGFFDALTNEQSSPSKYPLIEALDMLKKENKIDVYTQGCFVVNNDEDALENVKRAISLRDKTKGGMFEVSNVKLFLDGVVEGKTAYLSKPYENDENNYGASRWNGEKSKELLSKVVIMANDANMPCHFHAIGDQAVTDALDSIEKAYKVLGDKVLKVRNSITHLQVVKPEDIPRFKELGVTAVIDPWGYKAPGLYEETEVLNLGEERASKEYPYKSFLDAGVMTSFATDFGCSFICEPIECFHVLTTRKDKNDDESTVLNYPEHFDRTDAIKIMTKNVAYQLKVEDVLGTLEVGKKANLVILSKDLLTIPDKEIMSTKVLKTMSNGKWVFEAE